MIRSAFTSRRNKNFFLAATLGVALLVAAPPAAADDNHLLIITSADLEVELAQLPPRSPDDHLPTLRRQLEQQPRASRAHAALAQAISLIEILRSNRLSTRQNPTLPLLADITGNIAASDYRRGK